MNVFSSTRLLLLIIAATASVVLLVAILRLRSALKLTTPLARTAGSPTRLMIVLGSGGHTAELLSALLALPTSRYTHRTYLISSGDSFSRQKAEAFETRLLGLSELRRKPYGSFDVAVVPRARKVHQSILTAPWSCMQCWLACIRVLATAPLGYQRQWQTYISQRRFGSREQAEREVTQLGITPFPDLIITNGPATGLVVVVAAVFLRLLGLGLPRALDGGGAMRSIFVESWARVKRLSLSGRILVASGACQRVLVQWEDLKSTIGRGVEYVGPVVR